MRLKWEPDIVMAAVTSDVGIDQTKGAFTRSIPTEKIAEKCVSLPVNEARISVRLIY